MTDEQAITEARAAVERAWATLLPTIKALQDAERALRVLAGELPTGPSHEAEDAPPEPTPDAPEDDRARDWGPPLPVPAGVVAGPWAGATTGLEEEVPG